MPENDHVHSRLTHSLEVADVGKTLGKKVGHEILTKRPELKEFFTPWHFGYIVAASCLAHDIGNPPFGHSGEDTISSYFKDKYTGNSYLEKLNECQRCDLQKFEGNAQGFRILTRISDRLDNGGMQLTFPTLAAYSKYPQVSTSIDKECGKNSRKKYNVFYSELDLFRTVAAKLELPKQEGLDDSWKRHPLAFLTEAADDICYHILDLEDGCVLNIFNYSEYEDLIQPIAKVPISKIKECNRPRERITLLRACAITRLVNETACIFLEKEAEILDGKYDQSLATEIQSGGQLSAIKDFTFEKCYRHPEVVKIEIAGYKVVHCILDHFLSAIDNPKGREDSLIKKHLAEDYAYKLFMDDNGVYEKILRIIDIVSGMTDRYAVNLYRQLSGISLSSL